MNPFMEPTVASPQPTGWKRPSRRIRRHVAGEQSPVRRPAGNPARQESGTKKPCRAVNAVLRSLLLVGTLMLPGMASAVDINVATPEQLQGIKGIGPKTAAVIIEERERGGRFESIEDVSERVKGIGPKKAASLLAAGLTVGASGAEPGKKAADNTRGSTRSR